MLHRVSLKAIGGQAATLVNDIATPKINHEKRSTAINSTKSTTSSIRIPLIIVALGFLLGRAVILFELLPFVIPFVAVIYKWRRSSTLLASLAVLAGGTTVGFSFAGHIAVALLLYFVLQRGITTVAKERQLVPVTVFFSVAIARYVSLLVIEGGTFYHLLTAVIEGGLAMIVTMIFFQSVPLLLETRKKISLKHEEIVCLVILLASLMTGTVGWLVFGLSVEQIVSRYIVLIFAFVGGAAIGSTVGVVTGLILSLANVANLFYMSLLAFSGLLGGLMKEGKKVSVAVGLIIATLLMAMYGDNQVPMQVSVYESLVAVFLFMATPKRWTTELSKFIPGTMEHSQEQQQYLRKIRDVTAGKVEQFSNLFLSLSKSFSLLEVNGDKTNREREVDLFLSRVTEQTCQTCMKKHHCWTKKFNETYGLMEQLMGECEKEGEVKNKQLIRSWKEHCVIDERVIDAMKKELNQHYASKQLKQQLVESRRLVADQLKGVSKVMEDFAKDIQREKKAHEQQEAQIMESIQHAGLEVDVVDVYSLDTGNIDIDITLPSNAYNEAEKIVAPILTEILDETIIVKHAETISLTGTESRITFGSTKAYIVEEGIAHAAKGGRLVSGDSYSTMEIGAGKHAIAISDGMGNGTRAHIESQETIGLLKNILRSGIEETVAIKAINSILSLRSEDEVFSTLDLAMIDLQDGMVKFLKVGSIPSYIKRGSTVKAVEAGNLPIGIIQDMDVDVVTEELKAGDILIMMSDGIYEAPMMVENQDVWMKRVIKEIETEDPQEIADVLMERVIRDSGNEIHDDMTVVVAKLDHHSPKWATISIPYEQRA
ncbi:stage II sporulation protein E [Evansella cellulosilytica]|uniref:Stage II sporulation protein E, protein serine/threonine phosphatase n=1 Tax=Evansella cellulosilytica (strain ATCC 21833 / DSM 2522 / FERM P-1141 / JCM 9156 / N-4) TaxID=649639 RepID=E6TSE0_EVAC2|nr:stage II sporulation protein E [Evansella cellulosilytica]ADU28355.1 stage II sporulation protein E, protein serine/threonine phosphatase [Evansella cellulosilytica DSM 2522]